MGSWIYKNVEYLTDEEKQHIVDKEINRLKGWWGFKKPTEDVIRAVEASFDDEFEPYKDINSPIDMKDNPKEYVLNLIEHYTDKLNDIISNGLDAVIAHRRSSFKEYNGKLYTLIDYDFDDPCKVCCSQEKEFTDVNEFIEWLKNTKDFIGYYEDNGYYKDNGYFIEGFTEGLEKNIRAYFKKHGENSLLIKFG